MDVACPEKAGVGGSIPSLATMFLKHLVASVISERCPVESIRSPNSKKGSWYPLVSIFFDSCHTKSLLLNGVVLVVAVVSLFCNVVS